MIIEQRKHVLRSMLTGTSHCMRSIAPRVNTNTDAHTRTHTRRHTLPGVASAEGDVDIEGDEDESLTCIWRS